jgi:acyl-CoA thioester hydrolase
MEQAMSERLLTYRGTIYPWHCDFVGHMNVMWYVGKFDEATWHLFNALGLTPSMLRASKRGMAAVDQQISYIRELHAGDIVTVYSTLLEIKEKSLRFTHEMINDGTGEVAATTTLKGVHLDLEARKSCAFPEAVLASGRKMLGPG